MWLLSHSDSVAGDHGGEFAPAGSHGLRTGRLVIAIPSAETGDDPRQPSERAGRMRVLLACSLALERRADDLRGCDELLVGDISGGSPASIACVDKLDRTRCADQRDSAEIEQAMDIL